MTIERKVGMGIAGQPSGGATDVAEVFSTHLYTGTGSSLAINNGIDLAGEGGLVWIKDRGTASFSDNTVSHDGAGFMQTHATYGTTVSSQYISAFNSNGFSVGTSRSESTHDYASWTFRKKEKFFTCLTYTGNGSGQTISHDLDGEIGMMLIKRTSETGGWAVYHKSLGTGKYLELSANYAQQNSSVHWSNVGSTSFTVGTEYDTNRSGATYVAYLFADNSSEDAEDQMIKCGSYSGTGGSGVTVNLGWEAQWVMVKKSSATSDWKLMDNMRGMPTPSGGRSLKANDATAEGGDSTIRSDSRGFTIYPGSTFDASGTYLWMAIRAPLMVEPKAATDVFAIDTAGSVSAAAPNFRSTFPVDTALRMDTGGGANYIASRLTQGEYLSPQTTGAAVSTSVFQFDYSNGWDTRTGTVATRYAYMWKRAKGFMDCVAFFGSGSAKTIPHSLGVAPELLIVKRRSATEDWTVWPSAGNFLNLNDNSAINVASSNIWNLTDPTQSLFSVGTSNRTNASGSDYIAYLFATLAGISKVGSYTGNGSYQTIPCGFSAGSRFILIKRTDATGDWYIWDTTRGIVSGNDPHFSLNTTAAQVTSNDSVDPHNSGFIVNQVAATNINVSSGTYIFYAIA